jgi:aminoglycoside/choline kinase family phosphotransferase
VNGPSLPSFPSGIETLLASLGHHPPWRAEIAGSAGSGRIYWRIGSGPLTHILLQSHPDDADYGRFLSITRHLRGAGLEVPEIFGSDDSNRFVVLEDLGSTLLFDLARSASTILGGTDVARLEAAYLPALAALSRWQVLGTGAMSGCPDLMDRVLDLGALLWESSYFARRCAEDSFGMAPERLAEPALLSELAHLGLRVEAHPGVLIHRDFQSQNLLSRQEKIWFVDYQGARRGSRWYDLASLLWDPYVALSMDSRRRLFSKWQELVPSRTPEKDWEDLLDAALQRVMQALGAYGFLSLRKGVPWFARYLAPGLGILAETVAERGKMPALAALVEDLRGLEPVAEVARILRDADASKV